MQNKKIIHVTYELYPKNLGGIGVFVFMLLNEMSKIIPESKIEVLVPVKNNLENTGLIENRFENQNVSIIPILDCFENGKLELKLFCKAVKNYLDKEENKNSIIHFHDITLYHCLQNYKNVVYTFHKDDGFSVSSTFNDKKIKASIHFTKFSQKKHKIPAIKNYIIPNGLPLENKKARIAYIGRTSSEKGFEKFVEFVENSKIETENLMIGSNTFIHSKITSLGVLDNSEVNRQLDKIDYVFVPSTKEEFCLVILEALKKNKKIFVNNLKQLRELFGDFENVNFIDFKKKNFVKKIDSILEKDFYSYQKKLNRFSITKIAEKYVEVYDEL